MRDRYSDDRYDDEDEGFIDDYEEDGEEEHEEVREAPKPTKEEKDFLSMREQLKEKFRRKLLKERASTFGRSAVHETPKTTSQNKFGSFFGPSLPGIAPRVIEETRSIKENGYLQSSSKSSGSSTTKGGAPTSSRPKSSNGQQIQRPKIVNEVKRKAEILKGNRDYSFLFSDDADVPRDSSTKSSSQSKSDPSTSQPSSAKRIMEPSRGHATGTNGRSAPSTTSTSTQRHLPQQHHRLGSSAQRNPQQLQRPGTSRQAPPPSNRPRPVLNGSHRPNPSTGAKAPTTGMVSNKAPMRAVNGTSNHHTVPKKSTYVTSNPRPYVSSSVQRHPTEQRKPGPMPAKHGMKSGPPLKPQPSRQVVSSGNGRVREHEKQIASSGNGRLREHEKQIASSGNGRVREHENRNASAKRKPVAKRPFEDDDDNAIDMIRKMFNYNPNRYAGSEEDDSDMEVGFDVIQKEERLSSKIARKEDEEELRLIEEEERRERERMRKKQKMRHG